MRKIIRATTYRDRAELAAAQANLGYTKPDRLLNLSTPERAVLEHIVEFFANHGEPPSHKVVYDHFDAAAKAEETTLLEEVLAEPFPEGASYRQIFEDEVEEQAAQKLRQDCQEAVKIATQGVKVPKGQNLKGTDDAVSYLFSALTTKPREENGRFKASLRANAQALEDLYQERKNNPHQTYGIMTGYGIFDQAFSGKKKKHLTLVAGFGSHLKSTLMNNMIVNAATAGWNPLLFTSEMPADDVQQLLIAIHSGNPMFQGHGRPLNATRLLHGALRADEEQFYKMVKDDLIGNSNYGNIRVIDSGEFTTFGSIKQRTFREDAEEEVDELWIDYLTRLPVDSIYARMEITAARNETIADAKRFAMSWKQGTGLAVNTPFQVNREGFKKAKANEGRMDKTALAQYNAAEKEADNIMYIWFDSDEAATSEPKVGILKARWGKVPADPISLFIEPDSRRIIDMTAGMNQATGYAPTSGGKDEEVTL